MKGPKKNQGPKIGASWPKWKVTLFFEQIKKFSPLTFDTFSEKKWRVRSIKTGFCLSFFCCVKSSPLAFVYSSTKI